MLFIMGEIYFLKNDYKRVMVKCNEAQEKCKWFVIVSTYHQPVVGN